MGSKKSKFNRRSFLKAAGTAALVPLLPTSCNKIGVDGISRKSKKHIVTLSFDDGFKKSSIKTAEIYEKYKLSACINVIATGHLKTFKFPGKYIAASPLGDFELWNELQERGHEIMPHGYKHANKQELPFDQAKDLILRCLDYFSCHLKDFDPKKAVFNFPYNVSTPELENWLPTQVRAFRYSGYGKEKWSGINPLPFKGQVGLTTCGTGPGSCEQHLEKKIEELLSRDSGWLVYNSHGLDGEGWGPMRSDFLDRLLARLLKIESLEIMPAAKVLARFDSLQA